MAEQMTIRPGKAPIISGSRDPFTTVVTLWEARQRTLPATTEMDIAYHVVIKQNDCLNFPTRLRQEQSLHQWIGTEGLGACWWRTAVSSFQNNLWPVAKIWSPFLNREISWQQKPQSTDMEEVKKNNQRPHGTEGGRDRDNTVPMTGQVRYQRATEEKKKVRGGGWLRTRRRPLALFVTPVGELPAIQHQQELKLTAALRSAHPLPPPASAGRLRVPRNRKWHDDLYKANLRLKRRSKRLALGLPPHSRRTSAVTTVEEHFQPQFSQTGPLLPSEAPQHHKNRGKAHVTWSAEEAQRRASAPGPGCSTAFVAGGCVVVPGQGMAVLQHQVTAAVRRASGGAGRPTTAGLRAMLPAPQPDTYEEYQDGYDAWEGSGVDQDGYADCEEEVWRASFTAGQEQGEWGPLDYLGAHAHPLDRSRDAHGTAAPVRPSQLGLPELPASQRAADGGPVPPPTPQEKELWQLQAVADALAAQVERATRGLAPGAAAASAPVSPAPSRPGSPLGSPAVSRGGGGGGGSGGGGGGFFPPRHAVGAPDLPALWDGLVALRAEARAAAARAAAAPGAASAEGKARRAAVRRGLEALPPQLAYLLQRVEACWRPAAADEGAAAVAVRVPRVRREGAGGGPPLVARRPGGGAGPRPPATAAGAGGRGSYDRQRSRSLTEAVMPGRAAAAAAAAAVAAEECGAAAAGRPGSAPQGAPRRHHRPRPPPPQANGPPLAEKAAYRPVLRPRSHRTGAGGGGGGAAGGPLSARRRSGGGGGGGGGPPIIPMVGAVSVPKKRTPAAPSLGLQGSKVRGGRAAMVAR